MTKPIRQSELVHAIVVALGSKPRSTQASTDAIDATIGRGVRVLLAEDNSINQRVATSVLGKLGCEVDVANNGQEAVDKVRAGQYDLILMDVQMPVMDGFQATSVIREESACAEMPIIAMTAHAMAGDRERCLAAGMDDYLSKPIKVQQVVDILTKWTNYEKAA